MSKSGMSKNPRSADSTHDLMWIPSLICIVLPSVKGEEGGGTYPP